MDRLPEPIHFTLMLPPSVNDGYVEITYFDRQTGERKKRRVPTEDLANFKEAAPYRLHDQGIYRNSWSNVKAVGWRAKFYLPKMRCDTDNYIKFWQDAVSRWLGFDDKWVLEFQGRKYVDAKDPRVEVELYPLPPEEAGVI
jgi:Holliday junction resolvase RusA-like endonuclease